MKLRVLLNGIVPPLREWERRLLDEVGRALPTSLVDAFSSQVREINYVQRHQDGREINFYRMKGGEPNVSAASRISTPSDEYLLARVRVEQSGNSPVTCQLWVVCGLVFSITCNAATRKIGASAKIQVLDLHLPVDETELRNPLIDSLSPELRSEYEKRVADGRMFGGGVQLLEPGKLRQVVSDGFEYCVLGESTEAELLLARCEKSQQGLFFLNVEEGNVRPAANSLAELMNA
jgi:hypothetical protein